MRSRLAQVERLEALIGARVPCYRDPWGSGRARAAPDGKVYPVGERWDWRRIALRREAIGAILALDPEPSVRVVRDVLARYGHRVSHEQVRADLRAVREEPPGLAESGRWMSLEVWHAETARRRAARRVQSGSRRRKVAERRSPEQVADRRSRGPEAEPHPAPEAGNPPARREAGIPPGSRSGGPPGRPNDWAVWDDGPRRRQPSPSPPARSGEPRESA